ncbi:MAG: hypothetical protein ING36_09875 [Burkholderiales bacterium]|jgi:hypothetical protein|nr:hypothetical protein [Burkholderiales bacterium]
MTKPTSEHVLAVVKAGLNAVPYVGGSIASLIGDYIPTATQRNVQETLESLRAHIESLGNRIDVEAINREEFAEVFKSAYLVIVRTHQAAKLRAATLLVSNVLLREGDPEKLSYTEVDHYVRCLDLLSVGGIQTLALAVRLAEEREPNALADRSVRINFDELQARQPAIAPSLLMGLVGELDTLNLVHRAGVPDIRTANYGNYTLEVTPLGGRFAKHLLSVA